MRTSSSPDCCCCCFVLFLRVSPGWFVTCEHAHTLHTNKDTAMRSQKYPGLPRHDVCAKGGLCST